MPKSSPELAQEIVIAMIENNKILTDDSGDMVNNIKTAYTEILSAIKNKSGSDQVKSY